METLDVLKVLPPENEREYELKVVDYAVNWDEKVIKDQLIKLIDDGKTAEDVNSIEHKVAFAAFCVLVNYHRRMKNKTLEKKYLNEYKQFFEGHIFYKHMLLLNMMSSIEAIKNVDELKAVLNLARQNAMNLTGNVGGKHAYTETVVLAYEKKPELMELIENDDSEEKTDWITEATTAINVAIDIVQYPKFYCTYGRLLAIKKEYDVALEQINMAIDKEDNNKNDYSIRIAQYLNFYQQVVAGKQIHQMETAFDKKMSDYETNIRNKMQEYETQAAEAMTEYKRVLEEQEKQTLVKNMEFLGLFAGIVSFTIGSLTITGAIASQSIMNAAGLIIVLMGALMVVFASFGVILHGIENKKALRNGLVLVLGCLAILCSIVFCLK